MADENENETAEETTPAPEVEEAVAEEAPAAAAEAADGGGDDAEKGPVATPKERRRASRAKKASKAPAPVVRTPEERQAARDAARAKAATSRRAARAKARAKAVEHRAANPAQPTPPREHGPGAQKVRQGIVVSDKADKTITVRIDTARRHRRYSKIVRSSNTLHAHDERNDAHIGDTVVVRESRPLSRLKRWRLVEVVERAK